MRLPQMAVNSVVSYYESQFSNPITLTIDVGYGEIAGTPMESGALGESESYLTSVSYTQLESALVKLGASSAILRRRRA